MEEKGYAYQDKGGDVDFAVRNFKNYGELSGKKIDELRAGERVSIDETKRDPLDFVLWKKAKPGEPQWDSKWGKGRPGWHIECSAMACELLGETIDIHAGGPDLKFPHHENEIAQSQAATGKKFVNTWMHSGPLRVNGEKMSKSLGNFWTIRDALKETNKQYGQGNGNETLRFFLLKSQYRSPIDFSSALVEDAHTGLTRLYNALKEVAPDEQPLDWNEKHAAKFKEAMDDDFNTALAVSVLFELANEVKQISTKAAQTIWRNFAAACPEMTPQRVAKKHRRTLRSCGLSERKIDYILDICRYFLEEKITFELLEGMSEQEIIDCLTSIKGVGRWTAEMFLIFTLGRQNVFPVADLGIIKAIEKLYFSAEELQALDAQQKQIKILKLSENWAPYKTAASWFLWRSLNNSPVRY